MRSATHPMNVEQVSDSPTSLDVGVTGSQKVARSTARDECRLAWTASKTPIAEVGQWADVGSVRVLAVVAVVGRLAGRARLTPLPSARAVARIRCGTVCNALSVIGTARCHYCCHTDCAVQSADSCRVAQRSTGRANRLPTSCQPVPHSTAIGHEEFAATQQRSTPQRNTQHVDCSNEQTARTVGRHSRGGELRAQGDRHPQSSATTMRRAHSPQPLCTHWLISCQVQCAAVGISITPTE